MSKDANFLKRKWSNLKKVIQFITNQDKMGCMTDTPMENTRCGIRGRDCLDSRLEFSCYKGSGYMAEEVGDKEFDRRCTE